MSEKYWYSETVEEIGWECERGTDAGATWVWDTLLDHEAVMPDGF